VTVPEDRAQEPGQEVELAVAVVESSGNTSTLPPLIFLSGGPGGASLADLPYRVELFRKVITDRSVVFFDQRGVGQSQPALDCPELSEAQLENIQQVLPVEQEYQNTTQALSACKQRLESSGISLAAYTTAASADDVRDIVKALGYPQVYLMGVSYGTRLAQVTILRHQSEGWIAGAILDSVVPLQVNEEQEFWPNAEAVFNDLFDRCAAETACSKQYPNLQDLFYTLIEQLEANPLDVKIFHPDTGKSMMIKLDGNDFFSVLFLMMYDPYQAAKIPQIIDKVSQGDTRILRESLQYAVNFLEYGYEGMRQSVKCTDEDNNLDISAIQTVYADLAPIFQELAQGIAEQTAANCRSWNVKTADPAENQALQTKLPILILSGSQDPITPPAWGELMHTSLPGSYFYTFIGAAHSVFGTFGSVTPCAEGIMLAFLRDPTKPPEASCVQKLQSIQFAVPIR
jgi:pimeloyl-ACP methyl ester carboxylesterase